MKKNEEEDEEEEEEEEEDEESIPFLAPLFPFFWGSIIPFYLILLN